MKHVCCFVCLALYLALASPVCYAQQLSWEGFLDELAEERAGMEDEQAADWETLVEELEQQHEHPVDLNRATPDDLRMLYFMDDKQIQAILDYRARYGFFRSMGELLLIREIEWHTRQLLHLFAFVGEYQPPPYTRYRKDTLAHEVMARVDIPLYRREGWAWQRGLANQWRWDAAWGRTLQAGIRAETDAGEPMFSRHIKGWDIMGGYVQLNRFRRVRTAIIGDYKISFGEGVVVSNSFLYGKSSVGRLRGQDRISPHRSSDEYNFMRGGVVSLDVLKHLTLTAFYSFRRLDATIQDDNTVSTIVTSGLHRTAHELEQRHTLTAQTSGGHLAWSDDKWQCGLTGLFQYYNHVLKPGKALYQQISPQGYKFGALSVDYGYRSYPIYIHGESARSINAGTDAWASVNQVSLRMGATTQLSLLQRFYGKYYFSPYANSISENTRPQNESGVCVLFDAERLGPFSLSTYADVFYSPWPRYTMTRYSRGGEGMLQLRWSGIKGDALTARYQVKSKERSDQRYWSHRLRMTAEHQLTQRWQLRLSAHWHLFERDNHIVGAHRHSTGVAVSPQVSFSSDETGWRWTALCSWFRTDGFDSRIYMNEPRLQGTVSFPSLSGHGVRMATLLHWQPSRQWRLSAVFSSTRYFDRDVISSSFLQIHSAWKTDFCIQTRMRF